MRLLGSGVWFFLCEEWDDAKSVILPEIIRPMFGTCNGHAMHIGTPKDFEAPYDTYRPRSCSRTICSGRKFYGAPIFNCIEPKECTVMDLLQVCRKPTRFLHSPSQ